MSAASRLAACAAITATLAVPAVSGARPCPARAVQVSDAGIPASRTAKKRAAPPAVEPVVIGAVRYEPLLNGKARGLGQNGGDIVARDVATGAELWTLRVYTISYAANIEPDKQDVFISELSLAADGRSLLVTDERGRRYRVDTLTRTVGPDPP